MRLISGTEISKKIKESLAEELSILKKKYNRAPKLSVILVGENAASLSYVRSKVKVAAALGIETNLIALAETSLESDLLEIINKENTDDTVDGILVQLPLPKHIDEKKIISAIALEKDVDGFHPDNVAKLWLGQECIQPCTPKGIMKMLHEAKIEIEGKKALVIGRSNIVGKPIAKLLLDANASICIAHSKTKNLAELCKQADIIVSCVGKQALINKSMISEGTTIIDVGINRDPISGKICGDVDPEGLDEMDITRSPVPGGVGPMTITMLMENTVLCYKKHMNTNL